MRRMMLVGVVLAGLSGCERGGLEGGAEAAVRAQLRDPSSAKFSELAIYESTDPKFPGVVRHTVCGYVNARNGFGGYSGAHRFVAHPDAGVALLEPENDSAEIFSAAWHKDCAG